MGTGSGFFKEIYQSTYWRGLWAECYTMAFLVLKGYRILAWRYKTPVGEVDVIARRGSVLAFVEVKFRKDLDSGMESVTPRMQQRIARAATHFLASRPGGKSRNAGETGYSSRFDVVAVSGLRLRHLDNAWVCTT